MTDQMSTDALELFCRNRAKAIGALTEYDRILLVDVSDRLCALQSENAEKDREIEWLNVEKTAYDIGYQDGLDNTELSYAAQMAVYEDQIDSLEAALSRVEAERDAAVTHQKELDDALRDMVCQYCSHDGKLDHEFMSAGEHAFDVLDLDYGAPVETLWRGAQGVE